MDQRLYGTPSDPLDTSPPALTAEQAEAIAHQIFGVTGVARPLDSERDQNFRIASELGRSFVLKVSNPADDRGSLELQNEAMLHIARQDPALPVMLPLDAVDGGFLSEFDEGKRTYFVRLLTFQPGATARPDQLGPEALRAYGELVARMGLALRGFFHPSSGYKILWDLKNTTYFRGLLSGFSGGKRRRLVERVLDRFEERVSPVLPGLRAQVIHNDLTLDNVLLDDALRVSGIVDFGDLTHTSLICDLAIALVSLMWTRTDPLDAARHAIAGYVSRLPIEEAEADLLVDLVCARLVALVLIADWRVRRYPENAAYITANVEDAWNLLEHLDDLGLGRVGEELRAACLRPDRTRPRPPYDELRQRRERVLGPALAPLSYRRPLYIVRAEGTRMFDHEGRAYLDAYNNVPVVGHCHPAVTEAIARQSATLNTNTRYLHDLVVELGERIVATMPDGLDTVMFVNSGSEANDIAWRLATAYTGGAGAIVSAHAYHGVTAATIALSPEGWIQGQPPAHVETVPPPDGYRGPYHGGGSDCEIAYADRFREALTALSARGFRPAAAFLDSLFTSDGIFATSPRYLREVLRHLRAAGCLLVADEVQCGYGRSGTHLWSFARGGITPDAVTLGKPMGNGHPVAAVVTRAEIAQRFASRTDLFSTFGGNPVACAAALAVLDVVEEEGLQDHASRMGARLRAGIDALRSQHPAVGDVRGAGLLVGVDLVVDLESRSPGPELARAVLEGMRDRQVLVGVTGRDENVLKIRPPLVVAPEEVDLVVEALDATLGELGHAGREGIP